MVDKVSQPAAQASSTSELTSAVVALKAQLEEQQKVQASILLQLSALRQKSRSSLETAMDLISGKSPFGNLYFRVVHVTSIL